MNAKELYRTGSLRTIRDKLLDTMHACTLCPHCCGVDRTKNERGFCNTGSHALTDAYYLHGGEEPELVGIRGSGTIFFSYCTMACCYCQNAAISQEGSGKECSAEELSDMMLDLQAQGAHNINFVTPTHVIATIVEALCSAIPKGLDVPLVYNCGGYESVHTLATIAGVFDIYMPDIKYSDNDIGMRLSGVRDYWDCARQAVNEMHRQVGDLVVENNIARRGLLVRHLVLPNGLSGTEEVLCFLKGLSAKTFVNIMDQYYPAHKAPRIQELSRGITGQEYDRAVSLAKNLGLNVGH